MAPSPQPPAPSGLSHRALAAAVWIGVVLLAGYHLGIHIASLGLSLPMGSWETVYASIAKVWPNMYQWEHWMEGHDGYGPGYPTFVRPFLALGLDVYLAHRIANFVTLLAACALLARMLRRNAVTVRTSAALITLFYALHAGSYSIQARPDFLVALEIAAMLALGEAAARKSLRIGWRFSLALGFLALAAFFTKAYSAFSWAAILAYLALFLDWRRALFAGFVSGSILVGGILLFAAKNPLYLFEVYGGQRVQADPSFAWLLHQFTDFGQLAFGLILIVLWALLSPLAKRLRFPTAFASSLSCSEDDPKNATDVSRYWTWHVVLTLCVLLAGPAWHTGAYLTYFFHLLLVPLVMLAGLQLHRASASALRFFEPVLLANFAILLLLAPAWPTPDPGWESLRKDVLNEPGRVAVDYLMEPLAREKPGLLLLGNGQTGYILQEPARMHGQSPTVERARNLAERFVADQRRALFGPAPVDTLYIDCVVTHASATAPGKYSVIPRSQLPYLLGPELNHYRIAAEFRIRPYYFATNAPRQDAGVAKTLILKFVRKH